MIVGPTAAPQQSLEMDRRRAPAPALLPEVDCQLPAGLSDASTSQHQVLPDGLTWLWVCPVYTPESVQGSVWMLTCSVHAVACARG